MCHSNAAVLNVSIFKCLTIENKIVFVLKNGSIIFFFIIEVDVGFSAVLICT